MEQYCVLYEYNLYAIRNIVSTSLKINLWNNESVQNALIRTPYFLVPIVRIRQVRQKERFRNKFLQKERLNRINLLLYEHH